MLGIDGWQIKVRKRSEWKEFSLGEGVRRTSTCWRMRLLDEAKEKYT